MEGGVRGEDEKVLRWGRVERFEHNATVVLIFAMIASGLPILNREWFGWIVVQPATIDAFRIVHRVSAGLFVALAVFHVLYHLLVVKKTEIIVTFKDFYDSIEQLKYYAGLTEEKPKIGFHYPTEKIIVYWLMAVCFMVFMAISGFILLFPSYFPVWVHEWALIAHDTFFYLIVFVIMAHVYMTVLYGEYRTLPEVIFATGLIPKKFIQEHHPRWYREIEKEMYDGMKERGPK